MPYSQTTLAQFVDDIGQLMDDPGHVYWSVPEISLAVYEGLRVWGALTSYWRERGSFQVKPTDTSPIYDLSTVLPALRTRTSTLNQMVQEIQYMLLEAPSGLAGTGMSQQITVASILTAIAISRNRFVLDTHLPISVSSVLAIPPPPDGMVEFPQQSVFVHRASWADSISSVWHTLWREDAWAFDKSMPLWTVNPGQPIAYSESENAPLKFQLLPPPLSSGVVEALTVDSLPLNFQDPNSLLGVPDEWVHAIKYATLSYILAGEGQIKDMTRAAYAEKRYQQSVEFARTARSLLRLLLNNLPLPVDSLTAMDAAYPHWRNQTGKPFMAGALYDMVVINPGKANQVYGMAVDVVRSAPLPALGDYIQMGREELDHLMDYTTHILTFKCGGTDFTSTMGSYDSYMGAVSLRQGATAGKVKYLSPLFGLPQKEWAERPDRLEVPRA